MAAVAGRMAAVAGRMAAVEGRMAAVRRPFSRPQDDPPGTSRLFVAVPVADDVREAVGRLMEELAGAPIDERPGPAALGPRGGAASDAPIPGSDAGRARAGARRGRGHGGRGSGPVPCRALRRRGFPVAATARVLWLGIGAGAVELGALARRLNGELERLGWPSEDRPLAAHLTLARTDGVPGSDERARRLIEIGRDLRLAWQADSLVLYKSHTGHGLHEVRSPGRGAVLGRPLKGRSPGPATREARVVVGRELALHGSCQKP